MEKAMKKVLWFLFSSLFLTIYSCNNKSESSNTETDTNTTTIDTTKENEKTEERANVITNFRKFRIYKSDFDPNTFRKIILTPHLDDLANPTTMSLYFYPMTSSGGWGTSGKASAKDDGDAAAFTTTNMVVGNTEIDLTEIPIATWNNITYIVLEPKRDDLYVNHLGFTITAYRQPEGAEPVEVVLTPEGARSPKPSPPAPPAFANEQLKESPIKK